MQYDDNAHHGQYGDPEPDGMKAPSSLVPTVLQRLGLDGSQVQPELVAELMADLDRDEWYVRAQTVRRLETLGLQAPLELLMKALDDPHVSVRAAAVHAVGMLSKRAPVSRLAQALHDSEWQVREMAALALGTLGEQASAAALQEALNDSDATVREAARSALRQTHPELLSQGDALVETMPTTGRTMFAAFLAKNWRLLPRVGRDEYRQGNHAKEEKVMQDTDNYAQLEPLTIRSHGRINGSPPNGPRRPRSHVWRTVAVSLAVVVVLINVVAWLLLSHVLQRGMQTASGKLTPTTSAMPATPAVHGRVGKTLYTYQPDKTDIFDMTSVGWSPDGKRIVVTGNPVKTFDALTGRHVISYGQASGGGWAAWSPDGTRLAISSTDVKVVDTRTGRVLVTYTPPLVHPSASIAMPGGNPKASFSGGNMVYASAWSPDGKMIASAVNGNGVGYDVQVWNVSTGQRVRTLQVVPNANFNYYIETVTWSPDGKYIAASSSAINVHVWSAATGRKVSTFQGTGMTWSPNSKMIASLFDNGNIIQVREATTGHMLYSFQGPQSDPIYGEVLAWSPNGKYIAAGNHDVRIFNATNGKLIYTYTAHGNTHDIAIPSLSWSPDSTMIASLGTSTTTGSIETGRGASGSALVGFFYSVKVWIAA